MVCIIDMLYNFHKNGENYENNRTTHDRFSRFNVRFYSIDNFYIPQGGFSTFLTLSQVFRVTNVEF